MKCETCKMKRVCDELERMGKVPKHEKCRCYSPTKPLTNADRIRAMTDERLAVEMYVKGGCPHDCETPDGMDTDCVQCWLDWLKEEATECKT